MGAVDQSVSFHDTHAKAGEIVIVPGVQAGHLGRFTAHQSGARELAAPHDAVNYLSRNRQIELARGKVIEKKQRLCAVGKNVVNAHGHQINADSVVARSIDGELELGAHTVGPRHQDWAAVAIEWYLEKSPKTAHTGDHARAVGGFGNRRDGLHETVRLVDIDSGTAIGKGIFCPSWHVDDGIEVRFELQT